MSKDKIFLEFSPATSYNDAQAELISAIGQTDFNMLALLNCCQWSVTFRIICDDLDSGQQILNSGEVCRVSFWTRSPEDTLVFCQTKCLTGRSLDFDAWGGSAPRGPNVWSLLPDIQDGLALGGLIRKGWSIPEVSGFAEENELSEEEYFALQDARQLEGPLYSPLNGQGDRNRPIDEREFAV